MSVLDTIYVWHGCGSNRAERQAALEYAYTLVSEGQRPLELHENERDNDELFWMMLGGEDYAKADYWKWRKDASTMDPIVWRVQTDTDAVVRLAHHLNKRIQLTLVSGHPGTSDATCNKFS